MRPAAAKWTRRLLRALAVAYPLTVVVTCIAVRGIGEAWWVSTAALYLPGILFVLPMPFIVGALWLTGMRRLVWSQLAAAVLVVFSIMGLVLPWPVHADADAPRLRVITINVESGYAGAEKIVDAVAGYSPDVVLLQETAAAEAFVPALRARFPIVATSNQFALGTRFPLIRTVEPEKLPYEGQLRSPRFIEYVLDTNLGPISFFSVHPISPREGLVSLRGEGLRHEIGSGRLFEGTRAHVLEVNTGLRRLQVQTFSEAADREEGAVVIAGDTNLPEASPLLHRALGGYRDAFHEAGWGFGYTFPTNKWRPWMRIDRILARGPLHFVHFEVGRPVVSDHHFVVADLQLKEPAGGAGGP